MPKRAYCAECHYPQLTCICDSLCVVDSAIQVSILQDPHETNHAKNTARLAPLMLAKASIHVGAETQDFAEVQQRVADSNRTLLIYPSPSARPITEFKAAKPAVDHIILIDGTWRKAKKIWLSNPWLGELECAVIDSLESEYHIRKAPSESNLSTLEALASTLEQLSGVSKQPFTTALNALQQQWIKYSAG